MVFTWVQFASMLSKTCATPALNISQKFIRKTIIMYLWLTCSHTFFCIWQLLQLHVQCTYVFLESWSAYHCLSPLWLVRVWFMTPNWKPLSRNVVTITKKCINQAFWYYAIFKLMKNYYNYGAIFHSQPQIASNYIIHENLNS